MAGYISTLAPSRGATYRRLCFRHRRYISTLAPSRGATFPVYHPQAAVAFQLTPLLEGRHATPVEPVRAEKFQLTPLLEGRPDCRQCFHLPPYFNSRPYTRGDARILGYDDADIKFQLTPLHEGRPDCRQCFHLPPYFNSRHYTRGDRMMNRINRWT